MNLLKRFAAVVLVAVMALSLVGCGDTAWIADIDGETVPSGLYIYYQAQGYGDALYQLYQQDNDTYMMSYLYYMNYGYIQRDIFDLTINDMTVKEYINDYALDMCKQNVAVNKLYDELGLELSEDEKALLDNQVRNAWSNAGSNWEEIGVSEESFKEAAYSSYKEQAVFDAYYEIGGLNGTTEEEIETYFADNYARIKYMTFTFAENMDDAVDSARKDEQLELANSYLDLANGGSDFDELIDQYNSYLESIAKAESDAETDGEDTADEESAETEETESAEETEPDEFANEVIISKDTKLPTEKFVSYVFNDCPVGEFTVIQDDTCFYLVQRLDILEREGLYEDYRDSILYELFDSDYTALINDRINGYDITVNNNAVKRYKVEKAYADVFDD